MDKLTDKQLETIKLLTVSAICYQLWHDEIVKRMKSSNDIADLFFSLPTVQYLENYMKLKRLVKSGIDINKITSISEITNIFYLSEQDSERGME